MASPTSTTGADNGSAATRSTTTPPNHNHTSTPCLTGLNNHHSHHSSHHNHINAALANTSRHQLRTENSVQEASVAASVARMAAELQEFDRVMMG